MIKRVVKSALRAWGYDLVRHRPQITLHPDPALGFWHLKLQEALTMTCGQISLAEASFLGSLVADLPPARPIVEIGTLFGWSTRVMAVNKPSETELITVDNYSWNPFSLSHEVHYDITRIGLSEAVASYKVRQLRLDKGEFYRTYAGPAPALVFLDADHSYEATLEDINWAKSVNAGIICGHDYHEDRSKGVVDAVQRSGGARQLVETLWVL